ncbi:MAG: ribosome maturation factor RimP [Candidatus Gastranaerophilaceae bacterium]
MKEEVNKYEILEKITPLIENTAMRYNLVPVEIEFVKENHRWFLRVYLFSYDHPVNLEDCENVTRSMEDFLDELIPCKYYLEVSSPGLERKFKSEKEYLIFKGRNVSIKLKQPLEGETEQIFKAQLLDYDENEGITIKRLEDEKEMILPLNAIKSTKLYFE